MKNFKFDSRLTFLYEHDYKLSCHERDLLDQILKNNFIHIGSGFLLICCAKRSINSCSDKRPAGVPNANMSIFKRSIMNIMLLLTPCKQILVDYVLPN